jgi:hypothetical protein
VWPGAAPHTPPGLSAVGSRSLVAPRPISRFPGVVASQKRCEQTQRDRRAVPPRLCAGVCHDHLLQSRPALRHTEGRRPDRPAPSSTKRRYWRAPETISSPSWVDVSRWLVARWRWVSAMRATSHSAALCQPVRRAEAPGGYPCPPASPPPGKALLSIPLPSLFRKKYTIIYPYAMMLGKPLRLEQPSGHSAAARDVTYTACTARTSPSAVADVFHISPWLPSSPWPSLSGTTTLYSLYCPPVSRYLVLVGVGSLVWDPWFWRPPHFRGW